MQTLRTLLVLACGAMLMTACSSGSSKVASHIPKDAMAVVAVHAGSMLQKLEKDSMSVEQILQAMKQVEVSKVQDVLGKWHELQNAGIDWQQPFFIAALQDTTFSGSESFAAYLTLSDEAKFAAVVKEKTGKEVEKKDGLQTISYGHGTIAWKKEMAIITGGKSLSATSLFALKKDASMAEAKHFDEALAKPYDVMIFNSGASLNNPQAAMALAKLPKAKDMLEGIEAISWINFEDGKAVMESETYVGDKLGKLLDKYAGPEIDLSLVEHFPSQQINTVAAFSFKPQLIPALMEELGVAPLLSMMITPHDMSLEEVGRLFKGDFAIVAGDFKMEEKEAGKDGSQPKFNDPSANLVIAARIGDKDVFEKLVGKAVEKGFIARNGDMIVPAMGDADLEGLTIGTVGDLLVISNNAATWQAYASGGKSGIKPEIKSLMAGQSAAVYVDINSILQRIPESAFDNAGQGAAVMAEAKSIFQSANMHMANYKNGKLSGGGELMLAPGKNSLSRLANFAIVSANAAKTSDTALNQ